MKRFLLLSMVFLLVAAVLPMPHQTGVAFAQDGGFPPCTEEELTATLEGMSVLGDVFTSLSQLEDDPADEQYVELLGGMNAAQYEYWNTFYAEVPECLEAQQLSFFIGQIVDESFAVVLLYRLGAMQTDEGLAETFNDAADARVESLLETVDVLNNAEGPEDVLSGEWAACSDEEAQTAYDTLKVLYDAGDEISGIAEEVGSLLPVIAGYEALTASYWSDVFPQLPNCYEVQIIGHYFGFTGANIMFAAGIAEVAQYEANNGNTDGAELFAESATERFEALEEDGEFFDELFGEEEMVEE